jgi:hypothetical protein
MSAEELNGLHYWIKNSLHVNQLQGKMNSN